jgi:uncharacterized protein (TIGR03032 family)
VRHLSTVRLLDFEATADDGFLQWLATTDQTVLVAHSNKVLSAGRDSAGRLVVDQMLLDRVTGLCVADDLAVYVAASDEVWRFSDAVGPGEHSPTGAPRWLMPRTARFVGATRPADLSVMDGDCWFVSVALSALCTLDDTLSAQVRWAPAFISEVRPELRCRLTGLGVRDGEPTVVTSASTSNEPGGWHAQRRDGGVLLDIASDEIVAAGLSLPHSPRWHDGHWWLVQAGTGELGYIDDGRFVAVAGIEGFARGLTISHGAAILGGSGSRWDELVEGLPVGDRLAASGRRPESGAFIVDLASGKRIGALQLDGTAREIADVAVLAGTRNVEISGPRSLTAQDWTTFAADGDRG